MEEIIKEYIIGNDIVTYYETCIHVSLSYIPSEMGGSVLDAFNYSYKECLGLSPQDIIEMAWRDHKESIKDFEED